MSIIKSLSQSHKEEHQDLLGIITPYAKEKLLGLFTQVKYVPKTFGQCLLTP